MFKGWWQLQLRGLSMVCTGAVLQMAVVWAQRSRKAQPEGKDVSAGVDPGICIRSRPGAAREGKLSIKPCV
jgi:hypothetical protein